MTRIALTLSLLLALCAASVSAEVVAKIRSITGKASILRASSSGTWVDARIGMPLAEGDQFCTRSESFAEVSYHNGALLRMDENSKITIVKLSEKGAKTSTPIGNVWVNAQKLVAGKKEFELSTPTATAAIRGTVFQMTAAADSSTDVSVFDGKVAVGPNGKDSSGASTPADYPSQDRFEVNGPEEVPPPFEVSLEEWRTIVSGQVISIRKDGTFAEKKIDMDKAKHDEFVKKNLSMDEQFLNEK